MSAIKCQSARFRDLKITWLDPAVTLKIKNFQFAPKFVSGVNQPQKTESDISFVIWSLGGTRKQNNTLKMPVYIN